MRLDRLCLLSLDPARSSGWAVFDGATLHDSGRARTAANRDDAIAAWLHLAAAKDLVRAVVAEDWFRGARSHATTYAMGVSFGRWAEAVEATGVREDWILRIRPSEWRRCLGFRSRGRVAAKAEAVRYVHSLHGLTVGDDEADAICLGHATLRMAERFDTVLPATQRKLLAEATR